MTADISVFLAKVDDILAHCRESKTKVTIKDENRFNGHASCTEEETIEVNSYAKVLDQVKDVIIESEDDAEISFFKKLLKYIKANSGYFLENVTIQEHIAYNGYSEYTWWSNVEDKETIEVVDIAKLNQEIDEFTQSFQQ